MKEMRSCFLRYHDAANLAQFKDGQTDHESNELGNSIDISMSFSELDFGAIRPSIYAIEKGSYLRLQ
jgi:hypothetical protein